MNTVPKITQEHYQKSWGYYVNKPMPTAVDVCNKAIEIALAEQKSIEMIRNIDIDWQEPYITAAQARELGVGNAEIRNAFGDWVICQGNIYGYPNDAKYRAIKQAQHEPVDPHAALRAEYAKQVEEGTTGFYLWEFNYKNRGWESVGLNTPIFDNQHEYRYTDISCYVSKDGDTAIRMLRTEAKELQRKLGDTVDWYHGGIPWIPSFGLPGTYTYRSKASVKLDGKMVTPEQAAAEWEAKKETHDKFVKWESIDSFLDLSNDVDFVPYSDEKFEYELRPKRLAWVGSRENVIALLKEKGLL